MTTQELQLQMLRIAYRAAKTPQEREEILYQADLIKNPATPEEIAPLEAAMKEVMRPPDIFHPYWKKLPK